MIQIDFKGASIEAMQVALGEALASHIEKSGTKIEFASKAGVDRSTLYRLLNGNVVGTDVLLRVLRTLMRYELIEQLMAPAAITPMENLEASRKTIRKKAEKINREVSLFNQLKLANKKRTHEK